MSKISNTGAGAEAARLLVWSVWAIMTAAALAYVVHFGRDVPYWDEWNMVAVITKAQPVTLEWLWSSHNGHRIPLPRLLLLSLYKLSGTDFRVGMYFNVVLLSAAAAALIWGSARMRGAKTSIVDAIFPLLLLHWGHYENLLWSWQVTQILPVALACAALAVIAAYGLTPVPSAAAFAAVLITMLPMSGMTGLAYVPALVSWLVAVGWIRVRQSRIIFAAAIWAAATLTVILAVLYFQGYTGSVSLPAIVVQWRLVLRTAIRFIAGGLGPAVKDLWPVARAMMAVALLATVLAVVWAAIGRRRSPGRAFALLLFLLGGLSLTLAFAFGRIGAAYTGRYFALATPLWCAVFLAWPLSVESTVAVCGQASMLTVVAALTPINFGAGLLYGRDYKGQMEQFQGDLRAGMSPGQLVARHVATLCPCAWWHFAGAGLHVRSDNLVRGGDGLPAMEVVSFHDWISTCLRRLHAARIGDFTRMRPDDPPVREIAPSPGNGFTVGRATHPISTTDLADVAVLVTPDRPLYVAGIRVRRPVDCVSSSSSDASPRWTQVFWRLPGERGYNAPHRYVFVWDSGKDEQIIWLFQRVDQIALHMADREIQRRLGADNLPVTLMLPADSDSVH